MKKILTGLALFSLASLALAEGVIIESGPLECPQGLTCEATVGTPPAGYNLGEPPKKKV